MPRPKTIRTDEFPYHVTCRTNNKDWFHLPLIEVWDIFSNYLKSAQEKYGIQIISFVLMSNHIHLLLRTPGANIDKVMKYVLGEVSKTIGKRTNRINHVFGNRYKGCVIERESYFYHAYKYVYQNPAEANVVKFVEDYPFSTLHYLLHNKPLKFKCEDLDVFPCDWIPKSFDLRIGWLNSKYTKKENKLIEKALHHNHFQFSKNSEFRSTLKRLDRPKRCTVPFGMEFSERVCGKLVDRLEC